MRRNIFDKNYPVHVTSRMVEERKVFQDDTDCFRFVFQIYATNIGRPAHNLWRQDVIKAATAILNGEEISSKFIIKEHHPLVHFLDFALVMNHNHFYLVANHKNSIPIFMQRLNAGFARYINLKYNRKGALFGSRYHSKVAKTQFQSDAISRYISVINPLDVFQPGWREDGLKNWGEAINFLENYQFSSFPDKIGKRESRILAPPEVLEKYITIIPKNINDYKEFVEDFLKQRSNTPPFFLE